MKKLILTLLLPFMIIFTSLQAEESSSVTFTLNTIDNKSINITETKQGLDVDEFKGKAVLIALFGHQCPPCIKEIPEFIKLTNNHKDDLAIIAIEAQNYPIDAVKQFKADHKMNYNVVAGVDYGDFITYLAKRAGYTRGIPLPLLISIDKEGEVQGVQSGKLSQDELEFLVQDLNE